MTETTKTTTKKKVTPKTETQYGSYPRNTVVCTLCGEKKRTDLNGSLFCPQQNTDCPLIKE